MFQLARDLTMCASVFEFFGGILNAQTPSNSFAQRDLTRRRMEPPGAPPKLVASQEPLYYNENTSVARFPGSSTVEHSAVNRRVASSNLARGAKSPTFATDYAAFAD